MARMKPRAIGALNEALILISYQSNRRRMQSVFTSAASPTSAIDVCIAIVLLRRPRLSAIYSKFVERFSRSLNFAKAKLTSPEA
jgi:hypothetical protein